MKHLRLKLLEEAASLFYSTPNLRSRGTHKRSHPQFESPHRKKARHICQWVACDAGYKQSDVARFWGMHHTSVIYGCKMVDNSIETTPAEKRELEKFLKVVAKHIKENGQ
tara:strand:+ start:526 stop:855 length:330 start_codon:yes stop_codon:yes gene_type:complete